MIKNIKGTRAYDCEGNEVNNLREAWILFVDTEEAAIELDYIEGDGGFSIDDGNDSTDNMDSIFYCRKPDIYINTLESGDCGYDIWENLNSYLAGVNAILDHYNAIKELISKKENKND